MQKKIKLAIVLGTRPEIIRLSRVISLARERFDVSLIHTGQNYHPMLSNVFFEDLKLDRPDILLDCAGETPAKTIANVISETDNVFTEIKPDALLVLGDTNSCLSALSAKRQRIPIFHMEAGNRCFDLRVPEEINRKMVDHLADINMPYSSIARGFLVDEGFPKDQIVKTGSPMKEVLDFYSQDINNSPILRRLSLQSKKYFLISLHREENISSRRSILEFCKCLNALALEYRYPVIVSVHPRLQKQLDKARTPLDSKVFLCEPFGFFDYCYLQKNAKVVLSDSGTIAEETALLGFDALNLRETHERHEGMEEAVVMMVGVKTERIFQGIEILCKQSKPATQLGKVVDYEVENVSEKVTRIIPSYIDYVNLKTWRR